LEVGASTPTKRARKKRALAPEVLMSKLPRRILPGSTHFVSSAAWERRELFRVPKAREILVQRILASRDKGADQLPEFVVMPNHFQPLLTPGETISLEKTVQLIQGGSVHEIHEQTGKKMEIWQVGFHDWTIRDSEDYRRKVMYIQSNPVQSQFA
jgi:REP element-mobilizing transposase RayT